MRRRGLWRTSPNGSSSDSACRQKRIEQQAECRVRLPAVLRAESDEHDASRSDGGLNDGRATRDHRLSLEPAAQQDVFGAIARDRLDAAVGQVAAVPGIARA